MRCDERVLLGEEREKVAKSCITMAWHGMARERADHWRNSSEAFWGLEEKSCFSLRCYKKTTVSVLQRFHSLQSPRFYGKHSSIFAFFSLFSTDACDLYMFESPSSRSERAQMPLLHYLRRCLIVEPN